MEPSNTCESTPRPTERPNPGPWLRAAVSTEAPVYPGPPPWAPPHLFHHRTLHHFPGKDLIAPRPLTIGNMQARGSFQKEMELKCKGN